MVEYSQDLRDRATGASYFRDLLEVRRVALEHGLPFWNIVTCVQIRPNTTTPSPANLLLQGWTTLAAGGRGVSWYKYQQKGYLYCPIDTEHGRTATWSYLQMVNRQLKVIGPIVSRLRSVGVYFTEPAPLDHGPKLPGKLVQKLDADAADHDWRVCIAGRRGRSRGAGEFVAGADGQACISRICRAAERSKSIRRRMGT